MGFVVRVRRYEDYWTSQVGIPKWDMQDTIRFNKIYYGRALDLHPDDFGALRQAIMAKIGMTEHHCAMTSTSI